MFERAGDAAISKTMYLDVTSSSFTTLDLKEIYDVLIIDEASQMRPELSLPAIARSNKSLLLA